MVSTFAVTASGAVVLAATEELLARRRALREAGVDYTGEARALGLSLGRYGEKPSLWDVGRCGFTYTGHIYRGISTFNDMPSRYIATGNTWHVLDHMYLSHSSIQCP